MKFFVEKQCIGRKPDGSLDWLGHDPMIGEAVARLSECALANKAPDANDVALCDGSLVVDATLMDTADQFMVRPKINFS